MKKIYRKEKRGQEKWLEQRQCNTRLLESKNRSISMNEEANEKVKL